MKVVQKTKIALVLFVYITACLSHTKTAFAQNKIVDQNPLFSQARVEDNELSPETKQFSAKFISDPSTERFWFTQINSSAIDNSEISVSIPESHTLVFSKTSKEQVEQGYTIWQGSSDDDFAIFVQKDGNLRGLIQTDTDLFRIDPVDFSKNTHMLRKIDNSKLEDESKELYETMLKTANASNVESNASLKDNPQPQAESGSFFRVLVAYTPQVVERYGDVGSLIWLAAATTNNAYAISGVNTRLQIAGYIYVDYSFPTAIGTDALYIDRDRLTSKNDGYFDAVHGVRDTLGADVVVLLTQNESYGNYTGVAYIMATANTAFAVVQSTGAVDNLTFPHEIGHLQGARHNFEADASMTPYPYGHAFCYSTGQWRTIMSYNNNCPTRLSYFSNPNNSYENVAMGSADVSNNTRVLNETAVTIANFRQTPVQPAIDQNFYTYYPPVGSQASDLAGYDLWNIPVASNVKFIANVDIDGDKKDEVAVMRNEGGDYNLYVYKAPKCAEPAQEVARDLWNIPSGNNIVAMAGGDFNGDGKKDDIAVVKNENGDWNAYIYKVLSGAQSGVLLASDLWNIPAGNNVVSMTGVDTNNDGKDEIAVIRNENGDWNFYAYKTVMGYNPSVLQATDLWNIPEGNNIVAIAGGNFNTTNPGEEVAVMKNESGDHNLYIYDAPHGTQAAVKLAADYWNIPVGNTTKRMTGLDYNNGNKSLISVLRNETKVPSLPACHEAN